MGTRTVTTKFDDLDESTEDVRTVPLSFDGTSVELDLSKPNADRLAELLKPYLDAARKTGGRRRSTTASSAKSSGSNTAAVRAWATEQGIKVSPRGRISSDVRRQ